MKSNLLSAFMFVFSIGLAGSVFADSFEIIREGKVYQCIERGNYPYPPHDPGAGVQCAEAAYRGPFSRDQSLRLCQGAGSDAPALCGIEAYRGPFSTEQSVTLCQRAENNNPVDCASMAYRGPFSSDQSVRLCSGRGTTAHAECALQAYRGPYSTEEAVELCRVQPHLVLESLKLINSDPVMILRSQKMKEWKLKSLNKMK